MLSSTALLRLLARKERRLQCYAHTLDCLSVALTSTFKKKCYFLNESMGQENLKQILLSLENVHSSHNRGSLVLDLTIILL